jgi:hypothetical protein
MYVPDYSLLTMFRKLRLETRTNSQEPAAVTTTMKNDDEIETMLTSSEDEDDKVSSNERDKLTDDSDATQPKVIPYLLPCFLLCPNRLM